MLVIPSLGYLGEGWSKAHVERLKSPTKLIPYSWKRGNRFEPVVSFSSLLLLWSDNRSLARLERDHRLRTRTVCGGRGNERRGSPSKKQSPCCLAGWGSYRQRVVFVTFFSSSPTHPQNVAESRQVSKIVRNARQRKATQGYLHSLPFVPWTSEPHYLTSTYSVLRTAYVRSSRYSRIESHALRMG